MRRPGRRRWLNKWSRKLHRWGSIATALPLLIVLVTGVLLMLKKDVAWIQPPTADAPGGPPAVAFDAILAAAAAVPEAQIQSWADIDRLDVRPAKGVVKVRCVNGYEVQLSTVTGEVLQVARRRSELIESIHDGSFFHERAKLWVFLPAALIVLGLWLSGMWLWVMPHLRTRRPRPADSPRIK